VSIVRFATLCDLCKARSEEYTSWPTCQECERYVCKACQVPGSDTEDERNQALCKECSNDWTKHDVGCEWFWNPSGICTCQEREAS
jgi:hypothetical protein